MTRNNLIKKGLALCKVTGRFLSFMLNLRNSGEACSRVTPELYFYYTFYQISQLLINKINKFECENNTFFSQYRGIYENL